MNYENMKKMIDFLKELEEDKFYFGEVVEKFNYETGCGTVCCAIGWTPLLFPDIVEWSKNGRIWFKNHSVKYNIDYEKIASEIFDLSDEVCVNLFTPGLQDDVHESLNSLHERVPPLKVANMLEEFVKLVKYGVLDEKGEAE